MVQKQRGRVPASLQDYVNINTIGRIPFTGRSEDFAWLTDAALRAAGDNQDNLFGAVLSLLADCHSSTQFTTKEERGASYSLLHAVAQAVGMTSDQAHEWTLLVESLALSERHILFILGALSREVAT